MAGKKSPIPKIESNIPIEKGISPPQKNRGGKPAEYPFHKMDIGDSFTTPLNHRRNVANCIYNFTISHPEYKFTTQKQGDQLRVWRVEREQIKTKSEKEIVLEMKGREYPRKVYSDLYCTGEKAIQYAVEAVERMGADIKLTDAVVLLTQAKDKVAEYFDEKLNNSKI